MGFPRPSLSSVMLAFSDFVAENFSITEGGESEKLTFELWFETYAHYVLCNLAIDIAEQRILGLPRMKSKDRP